MKIHKIKEDDIVKTVIDGETDLCLGYNRENAIKIGKGIENIIISNWRLSVCSYNNKFLRKFWGIWQVIKYF